MRNLVRTNGQEGEDALHHLSGMNTNDFLVKPDNISQKGKSFDLCAHKIYENFSIKIFVVSLSLAWLQSYGFHDQRNEFRNFLVNILFV